MISFQALISLTIIVFVIRHSYANSRNRECLKQLKAVGFVQDNGFINFCHAMRESTFEGFIGYYVNSNNNLNKDLIKQFYTDIKLPGNRNFYTHKIQQIKDLCGIKNGDLIFEHYTVTTSGNFFLSNPFTNIYKVFYTTKKSPKDLQQLSAIEQKSVETYRNIYSTVENNDDLFSTKKWCNLNYN